MLIRYDSDGNEIPIAKIDKLEVRIRLKELKEYLAITKQFLKVVHFIERNSETMLPTEEEDETSSITKMNNAFYSIKKFNLDYLMSNGICSRSQLKGLKTINPSQPFQLQTFSSIINTDTDHESFIYGYDENGDILEFTCDQDSLRNTHKPMKEDTPDYVTPVYFKKEVLERYYNNPTKYTVTESSIRNSQRILRLVEINEKDVIVFLGDLSGITYNEQKYWRKFNIPPRNKMSDTAYKRTIEGEFTEPSQPDEYFKYFFPIFNKKWFDYFDWYLFKELNKSDQYHWKTLRIPLEENSKEFDEQFISLSKILVDSINDEIKSKTNEVKDTDRSIAILEKFCIQNALHSSTPLIRILRNIQKTRSTASAHRKGSDFHKFAKKQGFSDGNYVGFLRDIFNQLNEIMKDLVAELEDRAQPKEE